MENATVKLGVANHVQAMSMQAALLKTMGSFRKPANMDWYVQNGKIASMMRETEDAGKKDRKSPMDVMKVLTDAF